MSRFQHVFFRILFFVVKRFSFSDQNSSIKMFNINIMLAILT